MFLKDDRLQRAPERLDAFVRCYYERDLAVSHQFYKYPRSMETRLLASFENTPGCVANASI